MGEWCERKSSRRRRPSGAWRVGRPRGAATPRSARRERLPATERHRRRAAGRAAAAAVWIAAALLLRAAESAAQIAEPSPAPAQVAEAPPPPAGAPAGGDPLADVVAGEPLVTVVRAPRWRPGTETVGPEETRATLEGNLGAALDRLPGVAGTRQGTDAVEPVLRGLGRERVATEAGPVPVLGGCPSSMDPPVTYFSAGAVERVDLVRGPLSARDGPGGTGGRIRVVPGAPIGDDPDRPFEGSLGGGFDLARHGVRYDGTLSGHYGPLGASLAAEALRLDDYRAPDGRLVPAGLERIGGALALRWDPAPSHRLRLATARLHEDSADFPSLPMDNDHSTFQLASVDYEWTTSDGPLETLHLAGGVGLVDHRMSNRHKPNRDRLEAESVSESTTWGARAETLWRLADGWSLHAGADLCCAHRDALRTRRLPATGRSYHDHLWPDTLQWTAGLYGELHLDLANDLRLDLGARVDLASSRADADADPALAGRSIAQAWADANGTTTEADRLEGLGAASAIALWSPLDGLQLHLATFVATRPAGLNERYFAFGTAPGGFQVGNPSLDPEIHWGTTLGARYTSRWLIVEATLFHGWLPTFVLATEIDRRDVDGDGREDRIRGFRNTDAHLLGGEVTAELQPLPWLAFPLALAGVAGWNVGDHRDLPEIPPFEASAAVRLRGEVHGLRLWFEAAGRFAAGQSRIDPLFPENPTDGHALLDLRAGLEWDRRFHLQLVVDNLLDSLWYDHLARETSLASGDLLPGTEIPAPGRRVALAFRIAL